MPGDDSVLLSPDLSGLPADITRVGLRVVNSGGRGSIIGTLHATNNAADLGYEMPLRDSGGQPASTGGYPWRVDGDYQTNVSLTNVGTTPSHFSARLHFGQTNYVFRTRELPVGATVTFNIRKLRDQQIPDAYGNTIPSDLDHGQFSWSVNDKRTGAHINGRSEIVSLDNRASSSFSCWQCCENSLLDWTLNLGDGEIGVGESTSLDAEAYMGDCYNQTWYEPAAVDHYGSYDTGVLAVDHDESYLTYWVTAIGPGESDIHAYWGGDVNEYFEPDPPNELDRGHCESTGVNADAQNNLAPDFAEPTNVVYSGNHGIHPTENCRLDVGYEFSSTKGGVSNLTHCVIGEYVTYPDGNPYYYPVPFPDLHVDNPTTEDPDKQWQGTAGQILDKHRMPGTFRTPFADTTVPSTQKYRFKCTYNDQRYNHEGQWVDLLSGLTITRRVLQVSGVWKYRLTKTGISGGPFDWTIQ